MRVLEMPQFGEIAVRCLIPWFCSRDGCQPCQAPVPSHQPRSGGRLIGGCTPAFLVCGSSLPAGSTRPPARPAAQKAYLGPTLLGPWLCRPHSEVHRYRHRPCRPSVRDKEGTFVCYSFISFLSWVSIRWEKSVIYGPRNHSLTKGDAAQVRHRRSRLVTGCRCPAGGGISRLPCSWCGPGT